MKEVQIEVEGGWKTDPCRKSIARKYMHIHYLNALPFPSQLCTTIPFPSVSLK